MQGMALVIIGLFVLVWIISAVVKATNANNGPPPRPNGNRPRAIPPEPGRGGQRPASTDIERFMEEIDRLRNRGEGMAAGRKPANAGRPGSLSEPSPRATEQKRERKQRVNLRTSSTAPPPLPSEAPIPVLKPLPTEPPPAPQGPPTASKPLRPARTASAAVPMQAVGSPLLVSLQSVLKGSQGPALGLVLAEILGEAPGKKALQKFSNPS